MCRAIAQLHLHGWKQIVVRMSSAEGRLKLYPIDPLLSACPCWLQAATATFVGLGNSIHCSLHLPGTLEDKITKLSAFKPHVTLQRSKTCGLPLIKHDLAIRKRKTRRRHLLKSLWDIWAFNCRWKSDAHDQGECTEDLRLKLNALCQCMMHLHFFRLLLAWFLHA